MSRPARILALALLAAATACGDGLLHMTSDRQASLAGETITVLKGNAQVGVAGVALPKPIVFIVRNSGGNPLGRATGTIAVMAGGGSTSKTSFTTNSTGKISFTWTLGATGPQTVTIALTGGAISTIATATVIPLASTLTILSGDNQSAFVGDTLPLPVRVELKDPANNPIAGATITYEIQDSSGGGVRTGTAKTAATGRISNFWGLGWNRKPQKLVAKITGVDSVVFNATATTTGITFAIIAGNNQVGPANTALPIALNVELLRNGAPLPKGKGTFEVRSGGGSLSKTAFVTNSNGRANATWTLGAAGTQRVKAVIGAVDSLTFDAAFPPPGCEGDTTLVLNLALGTTVRYRANAFGAPRCLPYVHAANSGQQYLVLFEDGPPSGDYVSGYFPGSSDVGTFSVTVSSPTPAPMVVQPPMIVNERPLPAGMSHAWQTPAGPVYEHRPAPRPVGAARGSRLLRNGQAVATTASVLPLIGDTLLIYLDGIPRLGIPGGYQKVFVKYISNELIFAEDVRIRTRSIWRSDFTYNDTLTIAQMQGIANNYAAVGAVQGNLLFNNVFNEFTELRGRIIAVHTLMPNDNVWGYTYQYDDNFAFDYWVGTNGSTPGMSQNLEVVADYLFTHEIAHMRHFGLLEDAGRTGMQGNQWLVEGFAAFAERSSSAHRLSGTQNFSRTGNITLGTYPSLAGNYFMSDVPTYSQMHGSMFGGYGASSFVFDYLADQAGGDWRAKVRDFVTFAGVQADANAKANTYLPGNTFESLFTRARVALYTDDYGAGLPAASQYLQYNLRASRPLPLLAEPRGTFPKISPGTAFNQTVLLAGGTARGFVIDGTTATANANVKLDYNTVARGIVSVTRIK